VANTVTRTFAASNTAAGAFVRFLDTSSFTVGSVAADVCASWATGVTTNNVDIDLVSTAGPITLTNAVNTGAASTATVRLNPGGAVTQTAGLSGAITARDLPLASPTRRSSDLVANTVTRTFAASNTRAGSFVRFLDTSGFTVGSV